MKQQVESPVSILASSCLLSTRVALLEQEPLCAISLLRCYWVLAISLLQALLSLVLCAKTLAVTRTALHDTASGGYTDIIRLLLEYGADMDAQDNDRATPQHLAPCQGQLAATQLQLSTAQLPVRNSLGQTPLHLTSWNGYPDIIRLLLEHGEDVEAKDNNNMTPVHLAAYQGSLAAMQELLKHGANAHARDNMCQTPFKIASTRRIQEIIEPLSEHVPSG